MLAIIPARGGSKGLPHKNIKNLNGLPLIAHTIWEAKKSKHITKIIVSTDSGEIAALAMRYGAEVPFLRPAYLAEDNSLAVDNYIYTIEKLSVDTNSDIQNFVVLQPTSPLRNVEDIDAAIELFNSKSANCVLSVTDFPHPVEWAQTMNKEGVLSSYFPNLDIIKNRQELKKALLPNGAIYVLNYNFLKTQRSYFSEKTYGYYMPPIRSVDIDNQLDFDFAEFLFQQKTSNF